MAKKPEVEAVEQSLAYRKYLKYLPDKDPIGSVVRPIEASQMGKDNANSLRPSKREHANPNRSLSDQVLITYSGCNSDLDSNIVDCDVAHCLSPPSRVTSLDKTAEIVIFPSVRNLISQFNRIVQSDENHNRKTVEKCSSFNLDRKLTYSGHRYEDMSERAETTGCPAPVTTPLAIFGSHRRAREVRGPPKSGPTYGTTGHNHLEEARSGNRLSVNVGLKWRSVSDPSLGRKETSQGSDSSSSDRPISVGEGTPTLRSSWSRDSLTDGKSSMSRESGGSLSPAPSSTGSAENVSFSVTRPLSCDLCWKTFSKWDRSNSSDSAVVVEDEGVGSCSTSPQGTDSGHNCLGQVKNATLLDGESVGREVRAEVVTNKESGEIDSVVKESAAPEAVVFRKQKLSYSGDSNRPSLPPSVVISDYSGANVCVHVAYASDDFSLNNMLRFSAPDILQGGDDYICDRKVSDCSTCSSVSTVDMGFGPHGSFELSMGNKFNRRSSDCSSCYLTGSDEELDVEVSLREPSPPPIKKNSHWRKVRNVVQWSPFIQTYKRHKYPWVQLAGHQGNFKAGHRQGTIMKKLCPAEEKAFCAIAKDTLQAFVPEYLGVVEGSDGENYLQLQDLLSNFSSACVMDIKMGVRTYLEEELAKARIKPKLRKDMYDKMVQIDGAAPTEAEHRAKAVTKPRYMVWRETISSTATLGFRIEGVRRGDGSSSKDFKTTRTREQVLKAIAGFVDGYPQSVIKYIQRLKVIKLALEKSKFFKSHELIGSSLLFVHNEEKSGIWLIDFAKTIPLPDSVKVSHNVPWIEGTHEDGYLIGLENLIELLECIQENPSLLPSNNPIKKDTLTDIPDAELQPSQGNLSEDKLSPPVTLLEAPADENDGGKKITNYSVENRHSRLEVSALPDMLHFPKKNPRGSLSSSAKEAICEVAITTKNVG